MMDFFESTIPPVPCLSTSNSFGVVWSSEFFLLLVSINHPWEEQEEAVG